MGVSWHVTREPDNWARIYLRPRYAEIQPAHGFEITSYTRAGDEFHLVDVEDPAYFMNEVFR